MLLYVIVDQVDNIYALSLTSAGPLGKTLVGTLFGKQCAAERTSLGVMSEPPQIPPLGVRI